MLWLLGKYDTTVTDLKQKSRIYIWLHINFVKNLILAQTLFFFPRADSKAINKSGQTPLAIANFWNQSSAAQTLEKFHNPKNVMSYELVNHFSQSSVDRQSYKRTDKEHIESVMKSETSKFLVFVEMQLVIAQRNYPKKGTKVVWFTWKDLETKLQSFKHDIIFLGVGDIVSGRLLRETPVSLSTDLAYFAVNFKKVNTLLQNL